ncbi:MAG: hypothetical protein DRN68_05895 [Thaumarchaeota archaeon]|mgnify:CR=1 FL=1|nr:MAG: hypothetical protein DRN68_05895 [Nitrososphaerota archaeon]
MACLVIVEGISDMGVVEGIAEKIKRSIDCRRMRGNRPDKIARIIRAEAMRKRYEKAIVLKDVHKRSEEDLARIFNEIRRAVDGIINVDCIPVKRAVEAWILAGRCVRNAEEIMDPDEYLDRMMRKDGKRYIKSRSLARKLALEIDLERAIKYSPTLRAFIDLLRDAEQNNLRGSLNLAESGF